jgi:tight adherence protein B
VDFSGPNMAFLLLIASSALAIAGLWSFVVSWSQQDAVAQRSAVEIAEVRGGSLRYRLNSRLQRTALGRELTIKLVAAGVRFNALEFLLVALAGAVLSFTVTDLLMPAWLALIGAGVGVRVCWAWLERARRKRRDVFIQQLPEVARILSNASSAGLAITSAVQIAAQELDDPAKAEMGRVAEELRLGQSLERALANLEKRMPSREVGVLISTLVIQQRAGGDLVRALQDMALTLESRRDLNREIRTLMAGSVFTGWLVAVLGVGSILLLNTISPGVIDKMASTIGGQVALLTTATLYFIGFMLIKRVTRIEV